MAGFTVTCNQCGTKQDFSEEDPTYRGGPLNALNDWYFQQNKEITIKASAYSDPPEIEIECRKCKSSI